ncbi:MAG TPA: hypothetical protein VKG82_10480 [Solirubrobacteraceae bacterium]|nr:hypothetical protein [Solirubrobacteraceae bacterium]
MDLLRMAIELEGACDFGDRPGEAPENREAFLAHFVELEDELDEWNARVERLRAAPAALWGWFEANARKRRISEPPFTVGPLIDRLAIVTAERSRAGQLAVPRGLQLEQFRDRVAGGERLSLHVEGQIVAHFPSEPEPTAQPRIAAAAALVQHLFEDAQRCDEAGAIVHAHDALLDLKQPLLERLAMHASVDAIVFAVDCPGCRRARADEADEAPAERQHGDS